MRVGGVNIGFNQAVKSKKTNFLMKFLNSKKVVPYVLVSPFIISFLVLTVYPAIRGVMMSFQQILPGQVEFVGLGNYERVFNPTFYKALSNTTIYVVLTVVILTILPIVFAVILNSKFAKLKTLFRASLFMPVLSSTFFVCMCFLMIYSI